MPSPPVGSASVTPPVMRTMPVDGLRQATATPLFGPGWTETDFGGSLKVEMPTS